MAAWMGRRCIATMGGMRKAAATSSRFSEIIRRNSTTLAAPATVAEEREGREFHTASGRLGSLKKDKSLYLCFWEHKTWKTICHSIQSIRLSHVLAGAGAGELQEVACKIGPDTEVPFGLVSSVVGSKILFTGGCLNRRPGREWSAYPATYISEFNSESESVTAEETLKPSLSPVFNKPELSKPYTALLEVDGKLFSFTYIHLGDDNRYAPWLSFRIYDPNQGVWLPLDLPPYRTLGHAVAGTNIILWVNDSDGGFCRFDVTHPERGWTRGNCISCPGEAQIMFLKLEDDAHGFLMLSCSTDFSASHPRTIQVFLVSQEFDSLKPMQPLRLPKLPPGFCLGGSTEGCTFVHLGGQMVGLVFYNVEYDYYWYKLDMVKLALVTFEYEIITTDALDVKYHSLTARSLEYSPRRWEGEGESRRRATCQGSHLIGAYVL